VDRLAADRDAFAAYTTAVDCIHRYMDGLVGYQRSRHEVMIDYDNDITISTSLFFPSLQTATR